MHRALRVRSHIRQGQPDYIITADSWPAFLYPKAKGDVHNVEQGLLRSALLLKVCTGHYIWAAIATYHHLGFQIHLHFAHLCTRHRVRGGCG
jgi:hypothetical protein